MVQKFFGSLTRAFDELNKEFLEILFSMIFGWCSLWFLQIYGANFIVTLSMKNLLLNFAYGAYTGLFMLIVLRVLKFPIQYSMHIFALTPLALSYSPFFDRRFLILLVVMIFGYVIAYYNKKLFYFFKKPKKES